MNKRIKGWYIAAIGTEAAALMIWVILFIGQAGLKGANLAVMVCSGVWLPLFAMFVGVCLETKLKRRRCAIIAVSIPFALSAVGYIWLTTHWRAGFSDAGFYYVNDIARQLFYMVCGGWSFFLLLAAIFRVIDIRGEKYKDFIAESDNLFGDKVVRYFDLIAVITAICGVFAVWGYVISF